MPNMYETLLRPFEFVAAGLLETAADILSSGDRIEFRPAEVEISLPADLFAHADVQTEWWYYTGHCRSESGRDFGFELVFFKRRTDLDSLGIIPVRALANPMYFAHFGVSDITSGKFKYDHRRSFNKPFDLPVSMSESSYDLRLGSWSISENGGSHILHADMGGMVFDAVLQSAKPVVLNGDSGNGISRKSNGASAHFSFTRMSVSGTLKDGSVSEGFSGTAWMDREFGTWEQTDWDWFSIQFEDRTELMLYQYRTRSGDISADSAGTLIDADGACTYFSRSDYEISVTSEWTSPKTGTKYPSGWKLAIPIHGIEIEIVPLIFDQELDTLGSTMIVYWEGACRVTGSRAGTSLSGRAYVELVGYDKSHEEAGLGDFLLGSQLRRLRDLWS
jgi:predicted secreted hydrolase